MYGGINSSNQSIIILLFKFIMNVRSRTYQHCSIINGNCLWDKASIEDITNYNNVLNRFLGDSDLELFTCTNCNCSLDTDKRGIDNLCFLLIILSLQ